MWRLTNTVPALREWKSGETSLFQILTYNSYQPIKHSQHKVLSVFKYLENTDTPSSTSFRELVWWYLVSVVLILRRPGFSSPLGHEAGLGDFGTVVLSEPALHHRFTMRIKWGKKSHIFTLVQRQVANAFLILPSRFWSTIHPYMNLQTYIMGILPHLLNVVSGQEFYH